MGNIFDHIRDHSRLGLENKSLENKSGRIFCVRQVYKFLPINLYVCVQTNLFFFIYTKSEEKEYYDGGAVFIIQTSYKMQYFTIFQGKLHLFNIQDHRSTRGLLAKPFKKRQVQKSDRINSDRQSGSDQLGSTRTNSDRLKQ